MKIKGNDLMKMSTTLIAAFGFVSLAACGTKTDDNAAADLNADMDANIAISDNVGMAADADMTANGTNAINAADGMNSTENAMAKDLNTNDPDTNLANGM